MRNLYFLLVVLILVSGYRFRKSDSNIKAIETTSGKRVRFAKPLKNIVKRNDHRGGADFGDSRNNSHGYHRGIDLKAVKGESVFSSFTGFYNRSYQVYKDDSKFTGIEIKGTGDFEGFTMKLMYVTPHSSMYKGKAISAGQVIGIMQDISEKWGASMDTHIHIEIIEFGTHKDPDLYFSTYV